MLFRGRPARVPEFQLLGCNKVMIIGSFITRRELVYAAHAGENILSTSQATLGASTVSTASVQKH